MFLMACGSKSEKKTEPSDILDIVKQKGEMYCSQLNEQVYKERCDKLTFKALVAPGCPQDISVHENDGRWERDVEPCYPEFSKSSISRDSLLSVLHYIWTTRDKPMINRLVDYGKKHNWIMGDGPKEYTDATILVPMILFIKDKLHDSSLSVIDYLPTTEGIAHSFNGHLLASYIWLQARVRGSINDVEAGMLDKLWQASSQDPMYTALMHRIFDGNQTETLMLLLKRPEFPDNVLPSETGVFDWGSAPSSVYYLISLAIVEGK
jgi:hypothetical protein